MAKNQLQWRCRRGLLELDILLHRFLETHYDDLGTRQRDAFAALVEMQDLDLWHLVTADEPVADDPERTHVLAQRATQHAEDMRAFGVVGHGLIRRHQMP